MKHCHLTGVLTDRKLAESNRKPYWHGFRLGIQRIVDCKGRCFEYFFLFLHSGHIAWDIYSSSPVVSLGGAEAPTRSSPRPSGERSAPTPRSPGGRCAGGNNFRAAAPDEITTGLLEVGLPGATIQL